MRLLWAKVGLVHCVECGKELQRQTSSQIVETIAQMPEGKKLYLLAPIVQGRKGEHLKLMDAVKREGFVRMRVDGTVMTTEEEVKLDPKKAHTIEIVVDRLAVRDLAAKEGEVNANRTRLADSVELALKKGEGRMVVLDSETNEEWKFSQSFVCPDHPTGNAPDLEPRSFSFNSPHGACEHCHGLGSILQVDTASVLPNPKLSLAEGVIHPWATSAGRMTYMQNVLEVLSEKLKFSMHTPWNELTEDIQKVILHGHPEQLEVTMESGRFSSTYKTTYEGVIPNLERRHSESESSYVRQQIEEYMLELPCPICCGRRLRPEILGVTVGAKSIVDATEMSVDEAKTFFESLLPDKKVKDVSLSSFQYTIVKKVLAEIIARLSFLENVGLTYLTLSRSASSLSGGEAQRIRLATQIGSALQGVLYVLDEPSIGLHQRDNSRLIATITRLRDLGNTVIVVEHDEETMQAADYLLEIGPGAGKWGGSVIAKGTPKEFMKMSEVTGKYLSGEKKIEVPKERRKGNDKFIEIKDAHHHNLRHVDVTLPLGTLIGIAGVSGSGKSSLIHGILGPELERVLNKAHSRPQNVGSITGLQHLDKAIVIDQSPIGRTPRSNPATYTTIFTDIRDLFAGVPEAKVRGYGPGRFSFNVKGGRCEECEGDGSKRIEMHFLPDVFVTCEVCHGRRYNRETLEITYKGKAIADALEMTVTEAVEFFTAIPVLLKKLQTLQDVGLGYLRLGQSATTLSGGEAQRVKLASELLKRATGSTFYILDEPTTGLHFEDIQLLLGVLQRLVDRGNTVLVIEHNLDVLKSVDYVVDLGPDGGSGGGKIVATGTPEEVATVKGSYTGQYLAPLLSQKKK